IGRNISMLTQALQTGHKPQADKAGKALAKAWGVFTRVEQYFARPVSNPAVVLINPKQVRDIEDIPAKLRKDPSFLKACEYYQQRYGVMPNSVFPIKVPPGTAKFTSNVGTALD